MTAYRLLRDLLNPPAEAGRFLDVHWDKPDFVDEVHATAESIGDIDVQEADFCAAIALNLLHSHYTVAEVNRAAKRILSKDSSLAPQLSLIRQLVTV